MAAEANNISAILGLLGSTEPTGDFEKIFEWLIEMGDRHPGGPGAADNQ
jgi:hypothetical protein